MRTAIEPLGESPLIVGAEIDIVKWVKEVAEIRILSVKRLPLVTLALGDQALGDDAKLLAVSQRLPVGVGGSCHKERVDLILTS